MRIIQIFLLLTTYYLLLTTNVFAFTMEGSDFRLKLPDALGEEIESVPQQEIPTKEVEPIILTGFNQNSTIPFSFTISSLLVDFGVVTPTDPVTRTTSLIVQAGAALNGYQVVAFANHPLRQSVSEASPLRILNSDAEIKDTTCDSGVCTEWLASLWTNPLVFGSGFRVDNIQSQTASAIFQESNHNYFAQFSDWQEKENPISIMSRKQSSQDNRNDEVRVTHKVNIAATQEEGLYQNIITLIAIPNL